MTQNTEQNVRTFRAREKQVKVFGDMAEELGSVADNSYGWARREILEAETRGAEEQRRKDGAAQVVQVPSEGPLLIVFQEDGINPELFAGCGAREGAYQRFAHVGNGYHCRLYAAVDSSMRHDHEQGALLKIANVAALEAEIASLKEAEQLARADAEASKANAGWNFLTENVSSDPELPSCRLSTLFQEGDELSRFQQASQEFGIEVRLVADDREDEDCDKELSAETLSKFDPCQFLIRDGWSFVDVWENDDGGIIRLFARADLTREGGV
ncbi:MAG: hypothetical protein ABF979_15335 [Gluconobacter sp.]|uniref:hypothetical protein n=1 Tax=Gluconobacter sp. TaxID=1876758 RepID=UPI0039EC89D0